MEARLALTALIWRGQQHMLGYKVLQKIRTLFCESAGEKILMKFTLNSFFFSFPDEL